MKLASFWVACLLYSCTVLGQGGTLDSTFSDDAIVTFGPDASATSVEVQPDGKIITAGVAGGIAAFRYLSDGEIDSSFGVNGMASVSGYGTVSTAMQPDGKILLSSTSSVGTMSAFYLIRLKPEGTPDSTFHFDGRVKTTFTTTNWIAGAYGVAVQPDGKIVQVGFSSDDVGLRYITAVRYLPNGALDNAFGNGGTARAQIGFNHPYANDVIIQPDGKIVLGGATTTWSVAPSCFAMVRFNVDGTLDNGFGDNGKVNTCFGDGSSLDTGEAYGLVLQPDGKLVLAGKTNQSTYPGGAAITLARYNADGSLDAAFGDSGKVVTLSDTLGYVANDVALQPDGKFVVAGYAYQGNNTASHDFMLARYNGDGSLDLSFGDDGIVVNPVFPIGRDVAYCLTLQPDGKIVTGGAVESVGVVVRFLSGLELGVVYFSDSFDAALVYPNPIGSSAVLEYELINNETIAIDLVDAQGKLVQTFMDSEKLEAGQHRHTLSFYGHLLPGHYILRIRNGVSYQAVKIIKH